MIIEREERKQKTEMSMRASTGGAHSIPGQAALLLWANKTMQRSPDDRLRSSVANFTNAWSDGRALCSLAAGVAPQCCEELLGNGFDDEACRVKSIAVAMQCLERERGVPQLMDAEDWLTPDRNSIMTYVSEVRKRVQKGGKQEEEAEISEPVALEKPPTPTPKLLDVEPLPVSPVRESYVVEPDVAAVRVARLERENHALQEQLDKRAGVCATIEKEAHDLRIRLRELERQVEARAVPTLPTSPAGAAATTATPPRSPRRGGSPPPSSPVRSARSLRNEYPVKAMLVATVAGFVVNLMQFIEFFPTVPLLPFTFELVRFVSVFPVSVQASLALMLLSVGGVIAFISDKQRKEDKTNSLLQFGWYGVSRHPFYLGCALVLCGFAFLLNSFFFLLIAGAWIAYINFFVIPAEEEALHAAYGEEWEFYAGHVPKWLWKI